MIKRNRGILSRLPITLPFILGFTPFTKPSFSYSDEKIFSEKNQKIKKNCKSKKNKHPRANNKRLNPISNSLKNQ